MATLHKHYFSEEPKGIVNQWVIKCPSLQCVRKERPYQKLKLLFFFIESHLGSKTIHPIKNGFNPVFYVGFTKQLLKCVQSLFGHQEIFLLKSIPVSTFIDLFGLFG